ncbi:hypothetical protein HY345_01700 [Candidatus Microgenomates bacterium]|nr:hypothetical protein [Candidatus Microgenomates bacterium]
MKIDWTPSPRLLSLIKEIKYLHEKKGLSYRQIAKKTGHHFSYIFSLLKWDREMKGGENK